MKKECKVQMLPTEDKSHIGLYTDVRGKLDIYYRDKLTPQVRDFFPQHLYITSDEKIKEGDWYYEKEHKRTLQCKTDTQSEIINSWEDCRKIIGTTDNNLFSEEDIIPHTSLPMIPQSFISEYCDKGGIETVMVEYKLMSITKGHHNFIHEYELKLSSDNTIIIHPLEEKMYSKEEVETLISDFYSAFCNSTGLEQERDNWIKENL